jgi:glutamine amidotransferase
MSRSVVIVDYGAGNLLSVRRALEKGGAHVSLGTRYADVAEADYVVLPGVGAFRDGMAGLKQHGLDDGVRRFAETGRPLLGICLGMQMLASDSDEFGLHEGLGLIPGTVRAIPAAGADGALHKIPFTGWARLDESRPGSFAGTALQRLPERAQVYLVHSYQMLPDDPQHVCAVYDYDGVKVTAAVRRDNVLGCQFHPEKSGPVGLGVLADFLGS